jgi:serralysin
MAAQNSKHFCMSVVPTELSEATRQALGIGNRKAALLNEFKWPKGSILKVKFEEGSPQLQQRVRDVAKGWLFDSAANQQLANLQFDWVSTGDADIRIAFKQGDGSWSYIGTFCQEIPKSEPTMNYGWLTPESSDEDVRSVVLHEFGHALGLIHEHQNPVGGIEWNKEAVIADLSGPPNNWSLDQIQHNLFDRYDPAKVTATPVDPDSIMMYPIPASWTNGTFSADFNGELSQTDKDFIHTSYP